MSCFENSTFQKSSDTIDIECIAKACDKLGWKYNLKGDSISIMDAGQSENLRGEALISIKNNVMKNNNYYIKDASIYVDQLNKVYNEQCVEKSYNSILESFTQKGFSHVKNMNFSPTEECKISFYVAKTSKDTSIDGGRVKIRFDIMNDGTIKTDSDYIPEDVHILADEAMENLELKMGNKRVIKPKEVPAKYAHVAWCHNKQNQKNIITNKTQ